MAESLDTIPGRGSTHRIASHGMHRCLLEHLDNVTALELHIVVVFLQSCIEEVDQLSAGGVAANSGVWRRQGGRRQEGETGQGREGVIERSCREKEARER